MVREQGRGRIPAVVPAAVAVAWLIALLAEFGGVAGLVHHHALIEGTLPLAVATVIFIISWQLMIAAMMLPSTWPLLRLFATVSANQPQPRLALATFVGGYAFVWTIFGVLAFAGDVGLHRTVDHNAWLAAHEWVIAGALLLLAGAAQFSPITEQCLDKCRLPANFLMARYRRGAAAAFALGRDHGVFCVGCCWALMLLGFAAGSVNLVWMAALTALMAYEKLATHGKLAARAVGIGLLAWGVLVLIHPPLLPPSIATPF